MANARERTQANQNPGELLYQHLKNRYKTADERREKIRDIRKKAGIEPIKEAMKVDQAIFDSYQSELKPLNEAREHASYDRYETHVWDADDGSTITIGIGGEAARLDRLIEEVKSKFDPLLVIYKELDDEVRADKYEHDKANEAARLAAEKKAAEDELNNILDMTRGRRLGR